MSVKVVSVRGNCMSSFYLYNSIFLWVGKEEKKTTSQKNSKWKWNKQTNKRKKPKNTKIRLSYFMLGAFLKFITEKWVDEPKSWYQDLIQFCNFILD